MPELTKSMTIVFFLFWPFSQTAAGNAKFKPSTIINNRSMTYNKQSAEWPSPLKYSNVEIKCNLSLAAFAVRWIFHNAACILGHCGYLN